MAHVQNRSNNYRRNGNNNNFHRRGRRSHPFQRQSLLDVDGNIVMGGMEIAAPSRAPFNRPNHQGQVFRQGPNSGQRPNCSQGSNSSQGGRGRRRNRNRNRNRSRNGQNGQIVKPDMSPVNVHAHPEVLSHAHPQMLTQLDYQIFQGQAEPNSIAQHHQIPALQVASVPAPDYSWSSPIKYVHMKGELTPVDNCGDVVMGEAPSLPTVYSIECTANEHMLVIALSEEMGNLQLFK
ncbi:uncharacterized protein BHQ10_006736 [Talaromyces amestolkiae]|uniref:Uncharacterized protein n=1 Tax=Talaromyces amestolkiae TaxID=1196081 RepID=A0A364L4K3_TALAM|nr:uncharacterized protein BHQ10_006736 [Talaromyces amestolkiae]RAO70724.1 hypothetical protein BHQ10_006736 [Talaromyces amestolkiae]